MTDGTAEVAKAAGADRVIHEPVNQIARARNAGAAATGAEFLVFVDADTKISATLLTRALQCLRSGHCAGGAAPWSVLRAKPARSAASPSPSGSGFPDLPAPPPGVFSSVGAKPSSPSAVSTSDSTPWKKYGFRAGSGNGVAPGAKLLKLSPTRPPILPPAS